MTGRDATAGAATILDVARLAGVSRTTVSRVLNEPERVTAATLDKVNDAAARLNYHPSAAARTLRIGRTGTIALIVGDIAQPFHGALAQVIAAAAEARGMTVALHDLAHSQGRLVRVLEKLPSQGIDAAIIATADPIDSPEAQSAIAALVRQGIPVLTTMGTSGVEGAHVADSGHLDSAARATDELIDSGARSVALLVGRADGTHADKLRLGYERALRRVGAPAIEIDGGYDFELSRQAVTALLRERPAVDALVVGTLPMALGALRAAEDLGIPVPGALALISCEEVPLAAQVRPAVSTVCIDVGANGAQIMRVLDAALSGDAPTGDPSTPVAVYRETFVGPAHPRHSAAASESTGRSV
ncbi:LacI family DNA-binding transcriptional regulator [Microterricola viridarii]|uniref:LacI family transcriptional regulator n=1 Tax=Microterricola viridarii TaxID=412690 RepID=A0A1H1LTH2_9MICO|nr:LacI family DNA-binding transcriptional regulator [Microterricola viridarii]SDR77908.1 LacI family transcriptional regulator [Microterricola viridarii]